MLKRKTQGRGIINDIRIGNNLEIRTLSQLLHIPLSVDPGLGNPQHFLNFHSSLVTSNQRTSTLNTPTLIHPHTLCTHLSTVIGPLVSTNMRQTQRSVRVMLVVFAASPSFFSVLLRCA